MFDNVVQEVVLFGSSLDEVFDSDSESLDPCSSRDVSGVEVMSCIEESEEKGQKHAENSTNTVYSHPRIYGLYLLKCCLDKHTLYSILHSIYKSKWFIKPKNQFLSFGVLPAFINPLVSIATRILNEQGFNRFPMFDQMIANHYDAGEGLVKHIDLKHKFHDGIVIFTVFGGTCFEFDGPSFEEIHVEAGDLIVLSRDARWIWTHGIPARLTDSVDNRTVERTERISITLRKLK